MAGDSKYGRREFFKDSVLSVAKAAHEFVKHKDAPRDPIAPPARTDGLRPPGAVEEALFLERCTRCNDCAKSCPYNAIVFDRRDGSPVIFPDQMACHLCEDFPCIAACETEALLPVESLHQVRMGRAVVSHRTCTAGQGCHACVSRCPTEALSMNFDTLTLDVASNHCVGCGLCEQTCKTVNDHVAIRVTAAHHMTSQGLTPSLD